MQNCYKTFNLLLCCCFLAMSVNLFAQPVNDECTGAIDISDAFEGSCGTVTNNGPFTLTGGTPNTTDPPEPGENEANTTDDVDPIGPFCPDETDGNLFGDPADAFEQSVWYKWTVPDLNGDGSPVSYSIWTSDGSFGDDCGLNPNDILAGDADTQVAIYEGSQCPDSSLGPCDHFAANEDLFTVIPWISGWLNLEFTPGETYYMIVDGWAAVEGQFCLTVVVCGVEEGDGECAPVETYCESQDCRDECPYGNIAAVRYDEAEDGFFFSDDLSGDIFFCSERVNGFSGDNTYLGFGGVNFTDCNGENNGINITISNGSFVGIAPEADGSYIIPSGSLEYIELTSADIAAGSITITSTVPDGIGNMCGETITLNYSDYPQATDPYCTLTCFAGGVQESLLNDGIVACEDGDISLCTNGFEDLTLACDGGTYDFYWRAYVNPYGDWINVTGWIPLGTCPTVAVSDFLIDRDGSLPPDFTPGAQIVADPNGTAILIEGAALCLDAEGAIIIGCTTNNGSDFTTDVNGTNRTVIALDYYPAGDANCGASMGCTQTINLNPGWNLVSLDVSPAVKTCADVFNAPAGGNIEFITGFNAGAKTFDPNGPPFLNSLKMVADGFGYWVKATNADVLTISGPCIADDFRKPYDAGWNLVAYPPDEQQNTEVYFADLIANGDLEFVTGFDNGAKTFDPDGPPFLNTLKMLTNGFGNWVKVVNPSAKKANNLTNVFSFINGTSNLPVGEQVEILSEAGETVAILKVVQDSYLMTAPIYGDDATTTYKENISIGENLRFSWNNQIVDLSTTFKGDYGIEAINLEFKLETLANDFAVKAYPIPAKDVLNFEITVNEATDLLLQIFDTKGSLIANIDNTSLASGKQIINYNVERLAVGIYTYQLTAGNQLTAGKFNVVR